MSVTWNPWHGCHKYSEGCAHCYVYRIDSKYDRESMKVIRNDAFDLPLKKGRTACGYKIPSGETVYTCFTSDFLLEEADKWRMDAWHMIKTRQDLDFIFITKRIMRLAECLPDDWEDGYANVSIGCTCENQKRADERLPVFLELPIKHRFVICEPLLEAIELERYLDGRIDFVSVGGESGNEARVCDYDWVLGIRDACIAAKTEFIFRQTGARLKKDGRIYEIPRKYQFEQARRAAIYYTPGIARSLKSDYPN